MKRVRTAADALLEWTLVSIMGLMVINVVWQVITRFVLRSPSSYTEELARYLLIWLGVLGASYCVSKRTHLAIDVLVSKFEGALKRYSALLIYLCIFLFALTVMVYGGTRLVAITLDYQQTSAALQVKLGYVYLALPLSGVLILFYSGLDFAQELRSERRSGTAEDGVTASREERKGSEPD